jgi:hypothetical protein
LIPNPEGNVGELVQDVTEPEKVGVWDAIEIFCVKVYGDPE